MRLADITDTGSSNAASDRALMLRVILYALLFKVAIALILPLGVDEAYAVAVAREYSLSFFDHPPVSFWLPVAFAQVSGIEADFIYRLPFLVSGVVTTGVMYLIGQEVGGSRTALWTGFLYATAPFFVVSAGILAVPDGTLNLAMAVTVLYLVRIVKYDGRAPLKYWIYTGIALAFALGSKYQAAWVPVAVLLFMGLNARGRQWFLQPGPWLAAAIGLIGLVPVILWNAGHDWVSFTFHASRAGDGFNPKNFLFMSFGQALFLLPTTLVVALIGLWQGLRQGVRHKAEQRAAPEQFLLALLALGPILIFNYVFLTSQSSHAHWTMPGWQFALPLAGLWLARAPARALRRFYRWSVGLMLAIWVPLVTLVIHADTGFLTRPFYARPPAWDYTLSIFDFADLRGALEERGLWQSTDVFMASSWAFGGILDTALGAKKPMRIVNIEGAHHFIYLSDASATGRALFLEASVLADSDKTAARALKEARVLDPAARLLAPIILTRGGQPYVSVTVISLTLK